MPQHHFDSQFTDQQRTRTTTIRASFISGFVSALCLCYILVFRLVLVKESNTQLVPAKQSILELANLLSTNPAKPPTELLSTNQTQVIPEPKTQAKHHPKHHTIHRKKHLETPLQDKINNKLLEEVELNHLHDIPESSIIKDKGNLTIAVKHDISTSGFTFHKHFFPNGHKERNLIIGIASNIDPKNLAIFAGSLRNQAHSDATVIIFMNAPISELQDKLALKYGIILLTFTVQDLKPDYVKSYHPSSQRWILIRSLFDSNKEYFTQHFDKVLTLDIRDSAFQTDPFALLSKDEEKFFVFGENPNSRIMECGWNSGWIKDCFGRQGLEDVGSNPIICSGISLGTMKHMFEYIHVMSNMLLGNYHDRAERDYASKFPKCERNGVDQGLHNYLIHKRMFPFEVSIKYPNNFPVINMQAFQDIVPDRRRPDQLYMGDGQLFSVVHQYDRLSDFQLALGKKYIDWINWSDTSSEWSQITMCKYFKSLPHIDLLRGKCDVGHTRAMTAATCCSLCASRNQYYDPLNNTFTNGKGYSNQDTKDCTGFTFTGGICFFKKCQTREIDGQLTRYQHVAHRVRGSEFHQDGAISAYLGF